MSDLTLGIDLGSRAAKAVLYAPAESRIVSARTIDASPDKSADAEALVRSILDAAGVAGSDVRRILATGYGRVQAACADERTTEITCHAVGLSALHPEARTIIDIGGQDSKVILLSDDHRVVDFAMNDRCAAGTGRFLEVVARILGTDVHGLAGLVRAARSETEISSMCVVFAESEVIGMLAGGVAPGDVAAGIHRAIARRTAGLVERLGARPPIAFTGGVALNPAMSAALGEELRERLIIPADPRLTGALGAALLAARSLGYRGDHAAAGFAPAGRVRDEGPVVDESRHRGAKIAAAPNNRESDPGPEPADGCCSEGSAERPVAHGGVSSVLLHRVPALDRFDRMVSNAIDYAREEKQKGRKIISMFCEFTPRELILAAGAIPVIACGGSHRTAVAAERELPSNLCPLIKSSYGFAMEKANPLFEMSDLVVAETTCDGKKKMFELLGSFKPMHVLELPQKPSGAEGFALWKVELAKLLDRLEALTGETVTEDRLREAIRLMNRERRLRREIARLAGRGLSGREVLEAKSLISGVPEDLAAYEQIIFQARADRRDRTSRPAILMTGVPLPHGAEKVMDIIEAAGAVVVGQESCTGFKPLFEDVSEAGDPLEAIARKYFHLPCSCMTPNDGRLELLDAMIAEFKPRGVIDLVWQACLTYDVESVRVRRHLEQKHGLPVLKIVTDYSPSDSQQLRLRVEAFVAMIAERTEERGRDQPAMTR